MFVRQLKSFYCSGCLVRIVNLFVSLMAEFYNAPSLSCLAKTKIHD